MWFTSCSHEDGHICPCYPDFNQLFTRQHGSWMCRLLWLVACVAHDVAWRISVITCRISSNINESQDNIRYTFCSDDNRRGLWSCTNLEPPRNELMTHWTDECPALCVRRCMLWPWTWNSQGQSESTCTRACTRHPCAPASACLQSGTIVKAGTQGGNTEHSLWPVG